MHYIFHIFYPSNSNLTTNSTSFIFDYHDGKYGYNTNPNRGADSFHPFSSAPSLFVGSYIGYNNAHTNIWGYTGYDIITTDDMTYHHDGENSYLLINKKGTLRIFLAEYVNKSPNTNYQKLYKNGTLIYTSPVNIAVGYGQGWDYTFDVEEGDRITVFNDASYAAPTGIISAILW